MQDFIKRSIKKQIIVFLLIIFCKLTTWIVTNHIAVESLILKTHKYTKKGSHTELRNAQNFEAHGTSKISSKLLCILLYLNPYYSSYLTP